MQQEYEGQGRSGQAYKSQVLWRSGGLGDAYGQMKRQWLDFLFLVPILGVFGQCC